MNRVIHFEIPADDPEKTIAFYRKVFGWKFQQFGDNHIGWRRPEMRVRQGSMGP